MTDRKRGGINETDTCTVAQLSVHVSHQGNPHRCNQLRTLHDRLVDEVRLLRTSVQEEEEGFENPIEVHNIIAGLQTVLHQINLELQKTVNVQIVSIAPYSDRQRRFHG